MGLSKETKGMLAVAGLFAGALLVFFAYDRGYDDGYDDAANGREKYDADKVRNGLIYDAASTVVPDGVAKQSVMAFNTLRDGLFARYDAIPKTVDAPSASGGDGSGSVAANAENA